MNTQPLPDQESDKQNPLELEDLNQSDPVIEKLKTAKLVRLGDFVYNTQKPDNPYFLTQLEEEFNRREVQKRLEKNDSDTTSTAKPKHC
jgi:hypothetical protein